jgi:hypothetical protein
MAGNRTKPTKKQVVERQAKFAKFMANVGSLAVGEVPSCDALFEAQEVIADLITENCPIAKPTAKKAK